MYSKYNVSNAESVYEIDPLRDFAQIEIAQHLRTLAEKPFQSSMEIACLIENDQFAVRVEIRYTPDFFESRDRMPSGTSLIEQLTAWNANSMPSL